MADLSRAIDDISYLSKRLKGLVDLGDELKEAKQLLDQKNSNAEAVKASIAELEELQAKNAKLRQDMTRLDAEAKQRAAGRDACEKDWEVEEKAWLLKIGKLHAQSTKVQDDAKKEAEVIITKAQAEANHIVDLAKADAARAKEQLEAFKAEMAQLKSKF